MISRLTGPCSILDEETILVDVAGVGYCVRATTGLVQRAALLSGSPMEVHTWLYVRDDALQLFGFESPAQRSLFERLLVVQGVGPKVALAIVASYPPADIVRAVERQDVALLESIPGIGPKVARRLVTELADKLTDIGVRVTLSATVDEAGVGTIDTWYDARDALVGLGLTIQQAEAALRDTSEDAPVTERIRQALKAGRA